MTKEERQAVINKMHSSLTAEDKEHIKLEVNKWCEECSNANDHSFNDKLEILKKIKRSSALWLATSNVRCNKEIRENNLIKKDYIHNIILRRIFSRIQKAMESIEEGKSVTDL